MNLKEKMLHDYSQLSESQIDKIIEEARIEEERVREIVRNELNVLDEEVPF